jgi:hypothetical protein
MASSGAGDFFFEGAPHLRGQQHTESDAALHNSYQTISQRRKDFISPKPLWRFAIRSIVKLVEQIAGAEGQ